MSVNIAVEQTRHPIDPERFQRQAQCILAAMDQAEAELSILIVDDAAMADLNLRYRDHHGPTNVLAFPMREGRFSEVTPTLLGDVVISADTADREGRAAGVDFDARMLELLVHGVLHLCGYDHELSEAAYAEMEEKSEFLLTQLAQIE